jgi:glycosyltransferase involved in cell wall biosynthesis
MSDINERALQVLEEQRVAVFIVAYNAERHIEKVLRRIPEWVAERLAEIYVIDDSSTDATFATARQIDWPRRFAPLRIFRTPYNQGYGGNQRLGYLYAIEQGFDIVVLLHGDGQYAPEALPHILAPYAAPPDESPAAVFGSRFLTAGGAIRGGMPLYKFFGNRVLTWMQNRLLNARMSEMHSGYRSYRTDVLKQVPFTHNSQNFSFDADIIVQLHAAGARITEVPIPTFYGDEVCHVNGLEYARQCVKTALKYRLMQFEIFYDPKFDIPGKRPARNPVKQAPTSLHYFVRQLPLAANARVLDVGGGHGEAVSQSFTARGLAVTNLDRAFAVDLDQSWEEQCHAGRYDMALALDVLEHVGQPEHVAAELFRYVKSGGKLYASTPNVAFLPLRLMLLVGWFNYSRRGILDLTHRRLFTISAFRRLLRDAGFRVDRMLGFGPPIADLPVGAHWFLQWLDRVLARLARWWPTLFAYQVLLECTRTDSPDDLMRQMFPQLIAEVAPAEANAVQSASVHTT